MMISQAFNNFIKAEDLQDQDVRVIMDRVEVREVGEDRKPVLYFRGKGKGLVVNKTNANVISDAYGDETEDWGGKELILYPTMVDFQGRSVPAIRVKVPGTRTAQRDIPPAAVIAQRGNGTHRQPIRTELNDEVPF